MSVHGPIRDQAKLIVTLSPGIHLRRLQKVLGVSFTTTRYHVENLERSGELVRTKDGRYDRLYPAGTSEGTRRIYALLQSKGARRVLEVLADSRDRGLTNGDLFSKLHLPRSTISEFIGSLSEAGLVSRSLNLDGRYAYKLREGEEVLQILATFRRNLLTIAADGFIDLWDL